MNLIMPISAAVEIQNSSACDTLNGVVPTDGAKFGVIEDSLSTTPI
jgi:hypothetical protein